MRTSELRALIRDGKVIAVIKRYKDATGKGLKESKDFVDKLREEKIGFVDDTPPRVDPLLFDRYGAGVPVVEFEILDNYGSGLPGPKIGDFVPGNMSGTVSASNVTVDLSAIDGDRRSEEGNRGENAHEEQDRRDRQGVL